MPSNAERAHEEEPTSERPSNRPSDPPSSVRLKPLFPPPGLKKNLSQMTLRISEILAEATKKNGADNDNR